MYEDVSLAKRQCLFPEVEGGQVHIFFSQDCADQLIRFVCDFLERVLIGVIAFHQGEEAVASSTRNT